MISIRADLDYNRVNGAAVTAAVCQFYLLPQLSGNHMRESAVFFRIPSSGLNPERATNPSAQPDINMGTLRFLGIAAGMFVAVYFGMGWLFTVHPLKPDARLPTFHHVDVNDPRYKLEQSSVSDDDPTRDRLRHELLEDAKYLADDPCNDTMKRNYIKAANDYAHGWLSIVPCEATSTCRGSDSAAIDRAAQAFGSPLDLRVREAMQKVHFKRIFKLGDFPNDTAPLIANLANDGTINPLADENLPHRGPINAQTDTRPHPSMPELRVQMGEAAAQPACGG